MISAVFLEADELNDLQDQVETFFRKNPTFKKQNIIKMYFNSVPVKDYKFKVDRVEHRAFIVYEDERKE